jgi:hypothetical protein
VGRILQHSFATLDLRARGNGGPFFYTCRALIKSFAHFLTVRPHMDERSLGCKMNADACEKLANASTDHVAKATFHDLAHLWRELARRVEWLDRERPGSDQI